MHVYLNVYLVKDSVHTSCFLFFFDTLSFLLCCFRKRLRSRKIITWFYNIFGHELQHFGLNFNFKSVKKCVVEHGIRANFMVCSDMRWASTLRIERTLEICFQQTWTQSTETTNNGLYNSTTLIYLRYYLSLSAKNRILCYFLQRTTRLDSKISTWTKKKRLRPRKVDSTFKMWWHWMSMIYKIISSKNCFALHLDTVVTNEWMSCNHVVFFVLFSFF